MREWLLKKEKRTLNPMLLCDFYKLSHRKMYPEKTEFVYSTWTPRQSLIPGIDYIVNFGLQMFIKKYLIDFFNENFFNRDKIHLINEYKEFVKNTLNCEEIDTQHISDLHDLQYLPLYIKGIEEGKITPIRCPVITIVNTDKRFFWLTNYIETLMSCSLWQTYTSATISYNYKTLMKEMSISTCDNDDHLPFQCHDFSMRGMSSLESAVNSGMGHLLSFIGTDTIPAIQGTEFYYNSDLKRELIGCSIPATEHSIECAYNDDIKYFRKIINEIHPSGFVSIVCDGYDFWNVIENILPILKDEILTRNGKVVIRPDSGDPIKIISGDPEGSSLSEKKGALECLWDTFGGFRNFKGYKILNEKIGLIYGDSITFDRAKKILFEIGYKGFASSNIVFGVGSYTYQYNTRDTFGFALKTTAIIVDGKEVPIFKNPKTDSGVKKSAKGAVTVFKEDGKIVWEDQKSINDNFDDELKDFFRDGKLLMDKDFVEIRKVLHG